MTRCKYDVSNLNIERQQSMKPLDRMLDPTFSTNCKPCFPNQGNTHDLPNLTMQSIDVESALRKLGSAPCKDQFNPSAPMPATPNQTQYVPNCKLFQEYTHMGVPQKETCINRYEYLPLDPQKESRWFIADRIGINTSLQAKDNYKPVMPVLHKSCDGCPHGPQSLPCRFTPSICMNYA